MSHRDLFFHESILEMLAAFSGVLREQKIDFFLIGAIARDIRLSASADYKPRRITKDVDIAILVGSEHDFQRVKQALLATGDFTAHDKWAIRLFYKQAIDLDLLPFGGIEGADREVRIEKPQLFLLDMPGFAEVMPEAEVLKIGDTELRICSLEGIVLLKLFANADNSSRTKDITDIEAIKYRMEQQGLTNKDLAKKLGFKSRVSDIFKNSRKLNLSMIRKLYSELHIPLETLVKEY